MSTKPQLKYYLWEPSNEYGTVACFDLPVVDEKALRAISNKRTGSIKIKPLAQGRTISIVLGGVYSTPFFLVEIWDKYKQLLDEFGDMTGKTYLTEVEGRMYVAILPVRIKKLIDLKRTPTMKGPGGFIMGMNNICLSSVAVTRRLPPISVDQDFPSYIIIEEKVRDMIRLDEPGIYDFEEVLF